MPIIGVRATNLGDPAARSSPLGFAQENGISLKTLQNVFRRACVLACVLLMAQSVSVEAQSQTQTDTSPAFGVAFRPSEIKRQKLTQTAVQITLEARADIPEVGLTVEGATTELKETEGTAKPNQETISHLHKGQAPQITETITSADGYSGELNVTARMVYPSQATSKSSTVVPFETSQGELKLGATKAIQGGAIAVSAEPIRYTRPDGYVVTGAVGVSLKGVSTLQEDSISVTVKAEGVTLLDRRKPISPLGHEFWQSITFAAVDGQRGRITTQVSGKTQGGKEYVQTSYLYVLADPNQLLTSTSSFLDLDIQKLKADRAANRISASQYAAGLTALLSGATETSGVKQ
jgi:hypothetical protein